MDQFESGQRLAIDRLASEAADVAASIELVSSGVADRVTLTGMRFGRQLVLRHAARAARRGVSVETSSWTDDEACDVQVARLDLSGAEAEVHANG
jgi:hypothetical protein